MVPATLDHGGERLIHIVFPARGMNNPESACKISEGS